MRYCFCNAVTFEVVLVKWCYGYMGVENANCFIYLWLGDGAALLLQLIDFKETCSPFK
jgi:hypothetical protein